MPGSLFTLFSAPRATQAWHGDSDSCAISAGGAVAAPLVPGEKYRTPGILLAVCLAASPRFAACALHSGFMVFMVTFIPMVLFVGFATRYFETFFGHWSMAGPGRAFRIIPVLEGIGNGMMVAAVIRAAVSIVVAAIAIQYAWAGLADPPLASTYCRNFDLEIYQPISKSDFNGSSLSRHKRMAFNTGEILIQNFTTGKMITESSTNNKSSGFEEVITTESLKNMKSKDWGNFNGSVFHLLTSDVEDVKIKHNVLYCNEKYDGLYPNMVQTPAYNYFYIELLQMNKDLSYRGLNVWLLLSLAFMWFFITMAFIFELIKWNKLVWNISCRWLLLVPFTWIALVLVVSITHISSCNTYTTTLFKTSQFGTVLTVSHALEMTLYTHASGIGSELITGKGLNSIAGSSSILHAALFGDVARTSAVTVAAAALSALAASGCVGRDAEHHAQPVPDMHANGVASLWIVPMYSSCISGLKYARLLNVVIFGGMAAIQLFIAYILMKTALHAIFEFWIKLANREADVICLISTVCFLFTVTFITQGGPIFLECVDTVVSGLVATLLCTLEVASMLWLYAGNDLMPDLSAATTRAVYSKRCDVMYFAWKMLPVMVIIALIMKIVALTQASMPGGYMAATTIPVMFILCAIVTTGSWNAYKFYKR